MLFCRGQGPVKLKFEGTERRGRLLPVRAVRAHAAAEPRLLHGVRREGARLLVGPSIRLSVRLSVYRSFRLSVRPSFCLCLSACLSVDHHSGDSAGFTCAVRKMFGAFPVVFEAVQGTGNPKVHPTRFCYGKTELQHPALAPTSHRKHNLTTTDTVKSTRCQVQPDWMTAVGDPRTAVAVAPVAKASARSPPPR